MDNETKNEVDNDEPVVSKLQPLSFQEYIDDVLKNGKASEQDLINTLNAYCSVMKPGQIVDGFDGNRYQKILWGRLKFIVNKARSEDFFSLWNIVLKYFYEYKDTIFSDSSAFRFADQWDLKNRELLDFQLTIHLLRMTCNPSTRQEGLKKLNMEKVLTKSFTPKGKRGLQNFYNL